MENLQPGQELGPYRILEQIGQGGMATVFKAYQPSMQRFVALKVLPPHYAADPLFIERFGREAHTIAALEHRNILPVYDFGEAKRIAYLAMRYLDGGTLKDRLESGRPSLNEAADIIAQVCAALDYAHRRGVIHRDVKPANILIDGEGAVYLTDFGIAKILEGASKLTETGAALGTPAYMAPEQSLGHRVDGRTDIYALGVILYEMVVGRAPYQADTPMAVALAHIHDPLPLPHTIDPGIPEAVEAVIVKALAKNSDDRYQTASAMAADLLRAVAQTGTAPTAQAVATGSPPPVVAAASQATGRRSRWPVVAASLGAGALVVVVAMLFAAPRLDQTPPPEIAGTREPTPYDDFSDLAHEGSFNRALWALDPENGCDFVQQKGTLLVDHSRSDDGGGCELILGRPLETTIEQLGSFQGRMRLSDHSGGYVNHRLTVRAIDAEGQALWDASCGLEADVDALSSVFTIENFDARGEVQEQFARRFLAEYDRWYTVRLTLDPATLEASCAVDGDLLGSAVPDNANQANSKHLQRILGSWRDPETFVAAHFDDIGVLPP